MQKLFPAAFVIITIGAGCILAQPLQQTPAQEQEDPTGQMDGSSIEPREGEPVSVRVYFVETAQAAAGDCTAVDFEKRTLITKKRAETVALEELLKGPESQWAHTEIPEGSTLADFRVKDGVAHVNFESRNAQDWSGGSCHVRAIRTQIERTLRQFPEIEDIEILVNGENGELLEP